MSSTSIVQGVVTGMSAFPAGVSLHNMPLVIPSSRGQVFWVDNSTASSRYGMGPGSDGNKGTFDRPFATLQTAINACLDNNGDVIFVGPNHAETITAAGGIVSNKIGVSVIGIGNGNNRPTFSFDTSTAATWTITAANNSISGILGLTVIDQVVSPFVISANGCYIDIEYRDADATHEALRVILTTAAADNLTINLKYVGFPAGSHNVNAVRLVGCNNGHINLDYYGKASTAVVEFLTTACTNIEVTGTFYVSGTTDLSKNVVDTVTGSTWGVVGFDAAAGYTFDGGSGKAVSGTDVSAVVANMAVPTADSTANVLERDVIGNKTDAAITATGTTKSILAYVKGLITMGTVQSADSTNNAFAGDVVGNKTDAAVTAVGTTKSLLAYLKGLVTMATVQSADATNNAFAGDVIGNKTDASVYVPGTTKSLLAYAKGNADLQEAITVSATAVLTNGTTIFTNSGPIEILSLVSECVTTNDATAATLQYQSNPTAGAAATFSGASASLSSKAAGASVVLQGTALSTAPTVNASGPGLQGTQATGIYIPAGTITTVIGSGPSTGTWRHLLRYRPLAKGVTVS